MNENAPPETNESVPLTFEIAPELMTRINSFCEKQSITLTEFVLDALTEKLEMAYKERRRRQRI